MEIRAITLFSEPAFDPSNAANFLSAARSAFHVPVQTIRLSTTPLPTWWNLRHFTTIQVEELVEPWRQVGVDFISLGPVALRHDAGWLNRLPDIIGSSNIIFLSAEIADTKGLIDVGRCSSVADIIRRLSTLRSDGSANLQFGALANCHPGTPFFNAAYHRGGSARFAIATEAADLIVRIAKSAHSLTQIQQELIAAIEKEASALVTVAESLSAEYGIAFSGIDFSLAPFPSNDKSIGAALESLGLDYLGAHGSIFTAAFLTDAIGKATFPRCGFSGLFFPVLEDTVIAARGGEGKLSITDLLTYSAVCGSGLDTVPLPGDIGNETLSGILLDVAGLAVRLNKPMVARLMPLPGRSAGDPVEIDFPWFAKGRVMNIAGGGIGGNLRQPTRIHLSTNKHE